MERSGLINEKNGVGGEKGHFSKENPSARNVLHRRFAKGRRTRSLVSQKKRGTSARKERKKRTRLTRPRRKKKSVPKSPRRPAAKKRRVKGRKGEKQVFRRRKKEARSFFLLGGTKLTEGERESHREEESLGKKKNMYPGGRRLSHLKPRTRRKEGEKNEILEKKNPGERFLAHPL